jgi:putative membrane protein
MSSTEVGDLLAAINASLNTTSAVALCVGFYFIRRRIVEQHRRAMLTAVGASTLFLVFYVSRVVLTGTHEFAGEGVARTAYLTILVSHVTLAILVLPFILRVLYLVRRKRFDEHKRLARFVFPVWAYVSVTGLIVYLLLYQIYGYA